MGDMPLAPLRRIAAAAPNGLPLSGNVIRAGLGQAFGAAPFDPSVAPGDPGLFGPGSASWEIISEPAAIVGGIRALIVQLLHPLAMAGVADHSQFRNDALGRLQRTSAYVTATAFGATSEALGAAAAVRRVHRRVAGAAPDGRPYRADDPHLLAWVSVALTSSFLATHRLYALRPLSTDRADAFVAEQSRAGALLDRRVDLAALRADPGRLQALREGNLSLPMVADGTLPSTAAELDAIVRSYSREWEVGAQAKQALGFLQWPALPHPLRAAYLPLLAGAMASLDPNQRAALRLPRAMPWSALRLQTRAALAAMRIAVGTSPSLHAATRRALATPTDAA